MLRNKSLAIFSVSLFLFSIFCQLMLPEFVLCVEGSEHVAIEPFHAIPETSNLTLRSDQTNDHTILQIALGKQNHSSCTDIPISVNSLAQASSQARHFSQKILKLAYNIFISESSLYNQANYNNFHQEISSPITSTISALQTTVLLI